MVNQAKGRLFRRVDGTYLIYLPKDLCEDSMFPFKDMMKPTERAKKGLSVKVNVSFSISDTAPIALLITSVKE